MHKPGSGTTRSVITPCDRFLKDYKSWYYNHYCSACSRFTRRCPAFKGKLFMLISVKSQYRIFSPVCFALLGKLDMQVKDLERQCDVIFVYGMMAGNDNAFLVQIRLKQQTRLITSPPLHQCIGS